MRVMGVDPGLTRCGLSMIEGGTGRKVTALDVDVVRTPSDVELQRRLLTVSDTVEHWMDTHRPDVIAIERVFANQNANTAMGTAQAGGVIALAAARRGIDVHFHTPSEVKAAVTGNGRADKAQVTTMVTKILGLQQKPTPADAADALLPPLRALSPGARFAALGQMQRPPLDGPVDRRGPRTPA